MILTGRHCAVKMALIIIFGLITAIVAKCPCQRVGYCHIGLLYTLIAGGAGILMFENAIPAKIPS